MNRKSGGVQVAPYPPIAPLSTLSLPSSTGCIFLYPWLFSMAPALSVSLQSWRSTQLCEATRPWLLLCLVESLHAVHAVQ